MQLNIEKIDYTVLKQEHCVLHTLIVQTTQIRAKFHKMPFRFCNQHEILYKFSTGFIALYQSAV